MLVADDDFEVVGNRFAVGGRLIDIRTPTTIYTDVYVPLHGAHQGANAAVALVAVETFFAAPLPEEVVLEGFAETVMPGRFEVLGRQPLTIVDGAHNPPGADTCAQVFFDDFDPEGRRMLVVGTLRDPEEMLAALRADEFDVVFACTAPSPRGVPAAAVADAARPTRLRRRRRVRHRRGRLSASDGVRRRRRCRARHRQPVHRRRRPPRPPALRQLKRSVGPHRTSASGCATRGRNRPDRWCNHGLAARADSVARHV